MTTDPAFDNINLSRRERERVLRGMPSSRIEGRGSSMRRFFAVSQASWPWSGFRLAVSLRKDAEP